MRPIVIIGAGECGVRAAFALREAGYGGAICLVSAEPHLPYERPPLSKNYPVTAKPIAGEARFAEVEIELLLASEAEAIDRLAKRVYLTDGRSLSYDTLLLATGARARRFPGMEDTLTLRSLDDARAILERFRPGLKLAIIGGGFIGLELAATAQKQGATVTVIEAASHLMARIVPSEIADVVAARHRAAGVELHLGTRVEHVRDNQIALADGRIINADLAVAGVGATPNSRLAEEAGLKVDNGIVVDDRLVTSDPDIFAAGDCCRFPFGGRLVRLESWRGAQDQGTHVAHAIMGSQEPYSRPPWFWSDQYDLTLQVAGLPDPAHRHVRRELGNGAFVRFELDDAGRLMAASGIGIGNAVAKDIRLAEKMIEKGLRPDPARLADPALNLKNLLKGGEQA